jgi:hypothetical protein
VPFFRLRIARATFFAAPLEYFLAMMFPRRVGRSL